MHVRLAINQSKWIQTSKSIEPKEITNSSEQPSITLILIKAIAILAMILRMY